MTTNEMLTIVLNNIKEDTTAVMLNSPREIPHGGMAVDVKEYTGKTFQVVCFQVYGTDEVLSDAEEILNDVNMDIDPYSHRTILLMLRAKRQRLSGFASVKVFPKEDACEKHLLAMKSRIEKMNLFSNFVLLHKNGKFEFIIDVHGIDEFEASCIGPQMH